MGFLSLLLVASMPIVQVLLIGLVGAYLATGYSNILTPSARKDINKVVFAVFTPALMFTSLARTVTLQDAISWWFMPVNIGIIFFVGGVLGWVAVKILRPAPHLGGLIIASCSAGNLGNLLLIIIPAVCEEDGNPFGRVPRICRSRGLSYASFSMALGGFFIWTHTFSLMNKASKVYHKMQSRNNAVLETDQLGYIKNDDDDRVKLEGEGTASDQEALSPESDKQIEGKEQNATMVPLLSSGHLSGTKRNFWVMLKDTTHQILEELLAPPTVSAIIGFIVGAIPWLKSLIIGEHSPLHVIQETLELLGNGTIPCTTLILGGNLTKGLRKPVIKPVVIVMIICIRYVILPAVGIAVVKLAYEVGFLPHDLLYHYVLMIQYALPPAMSIGTMSQLYDVGQEECSVIFMWTYMIAAIALTVWSTVFMSILS